MSSGSFLSRSSFTAAALLLAPLASVVAHAQEELPLVSVVVVTADTREPLSGALVLVRGTDMRVATNESGIACLQKVRTGARTVEVRHAGYLPTQAGVTVGPNATELLQVEMIPAPLTLEGVEVEGRRLSALTGNGFYSRERSGQGTFLTRKQIEETRATSMNDLMRRVEGISLTPAPGPGRDFGQMRASSRGSAGLACQPQVFLDGAQTNIVNLDDVRPDQLEGLEIYMGAATIPAEYNRGLAMCGLILMWTKRD